MSFIESMWRSPLVGIDIGVSGIKAIELSQSKTPRLAGYNRVPLPVGAVGENGQIHDEGIVVKALKTLLNSKIFSTSRAAIGLPASGVILRKITVPRMPHSELRHQLYWEAEQYLPVDINDVNVDSAILGLNDKSGPTAMMDVLLVAARKDTVGLFSSVVQQSGWQIQVMDSQAFALGNSFIFSHGGRWNDTQSDVACLLVDIGAGQSKLVVVERDKTTFSHALGFGGIQCTQWISERLGVSFAEAEQLKILQAEDPSVARILEEFLSHLAQEASRAVSSFLSEAGDKTLQGVYLCGGGASLPGVLPAFETKFSLPVYALNPVHNVGGSGRALPKQALHEVKEVGAVGLGLALRNAGDST